MSGANFCLCRFCFSIPGRCTGFECRKKAHGGFRNLVDGGDERVFVRFRGVMKAADFSYELKGRCPNLVSGGRRLEIK
jgi:hypothetical protein